jgi:hypothetical protein
MRTPAAGGIRYEPPPVVSDVLSLPGKVKEVVEYDKPVQAYGPIAGSIVPRQAINAINATSKVPIVGSKVKAVVAPLSAFSGDYARNSGTIGKQLTGMMARDFISNKETRKALLQPKNYSIAKAMLGLESNGDLPYIFPEQSKEFGGFNRPLRVLSDASAFANGYAAIPGAAQSAVTGTRTAVGVLKLREALTSSDPNSVNNFYVDNANASPLHRFVNGATTIADRGVSQMDSQKYKQYKAYESKYLAKKKEEADYARNVPNMLMNNVINNGVNVARGTPEAIRRTIPRDIPKTDNDVLSSHYRNNASVGSFFPYR